MKFKEFLKEDPTDGLEVFGYISGSGKLVPKDQLLFDGNKINKDVETVNVKATKASTFKFPWIFSSSSKFSSLRIGDVGPYTNEYGQYESKRIEINDFSGFPDVKQIYISNHAVVTSFKGIENLKTGTLHFQCEIDCSIVRLFKSTISHIWFDPMNYMTKAEQDAQYKLSGVFKELHDGPKMDLIDYQNALIDAGLEKYA